MTQDGESGFTLLETVCVLTIVALLAALSLPALPRATSRPRLEAYALDVAALLKADRFAAMLGGAPVATALDPLTMTVRSGASKRSVELPRDVGFDALLPQRCGARAVEATIDFFPSGMSCGGAIALSRLGVVYQIRVNWLTGGVEVVAVEKP
ncbi:prepilin-type N-terminal cleavage/methylation domain-containing protein [Methylocapsa sp. S129]|uniref:prepilin-type N-terminal cleavage/methylation domain-containing protein n=1 Tax=Methylocapsa sp. S129 TaxID=1641869 RepID=UPI00131BB5FA|nr:prepilin-type N-terminal cleavage/methylation domain-containing protein [Methylocapsa sp. S129]